MVLDEVARTKVSVRIIATYYLMWKAALYGTILMVSNESMVSSNFVAGLLLYVLGLCSLIQSSIARAALNVDPPARQCIYFIYALAPLEVAVMHVYCPCLTRIAMIAPCLVVIPMALYFSPKRRGKLDQIVARIVCPQDRS